MRLVTSRCNPCLVRQLTVQKTVRSLGRGPGVAGSLRAEVARGFYPGSGLRRVIPYILLVFVIHGGGISRARGLQWCV